MKSRIQIGTRFWHVLMLLLVVMVAFQACQPTAPTPPPNVVVNANPVIIIGGGAAVDPTVPAGGAVSFVTINAFGEPLRRESSGACERGQREIAVGCQQAVTCNPRDKDHNVIFNEAVTGKAPQSFELVPGSDPSVAAEGASENGFNKFLTGKKPGILTYVCVVKGVTSPPTAFTVVP